MRRKSALIPLIILIIYWALPIDFIPDFIVGLGQLDDIIVTVISIATMLHRIGNRDVVDDSEY